MTIKISDRIVIDPSILHGKPIIEGSRVPVHMVLGLLGNGLSPEEIKRDYYNFISIKDILACIQYAKKYWKRIYL